MTEGQEKKLKAIGILRARVAQQAGALEAIDHRLAEYLRGLVTDSTAEMNDPGDLHNYYEILGGIKFLRLLRTYEFNEKTVRQMLYMFEGRWDEDGRGVWRYVKGGLKQPGTTRPQVYRWQPFDVFTFAWTFGFYGWIDTQLTLKDRAELNETERLNDAGHIEDYRRICTAFTLYTPRKCNKTGKSAAVGTYMFFLGGDHNSEIYCCANAKDQATILFTRIRGFVAQLDSGGSVRQTATVIDWRPAMKEFRDSSIRPLSAGGKTKDGMFAEVLLDDESGSSEWVNGHNDLFSLINVTASSMGPRRQPLQFSTTTAGTIQSGFFIEKLDSLHKMLELEIAYDEGTETPVLELDRIGCLLLEPDEWEKSDEDYLLTSLSVRRKVNPMLGITVQHSFYDEWVTKARMEPEKMSEVLSKLFNVYTSAKMVEWIKPEEIRPLQQPVRIDDCTAANGWAVFAGADFSKGDDLNTMGWLAVNLRTRRFFADADCWVSLEAAQKSPIWPLYQQWEKEGWLTIVPGKTFDPSAVVTRVAELTQKGVNIWRIGYDPYNAAIVINALSAYIHDVLDRDPMQYIMVVKQGYATYNSLVNEFDYMIHRSDADGRPDPQITFSMNPMIPWQFGNVALGVSTDGYENKKPIKRNPGSEACKVDSVQAILSALKCYDVVDGGEVSKED